MYLAFFIMTLIATGLAVWQVRFRNARPDRQAGDGAKGFAAFQRTYLMVYYLMMAGDWLQGPYIYALYDSYGYTKGDISVLFVMGFGSSMIFGTVVGALADRFGRRRLCIIYALLYALSCLTKHFDNFVMLSIGRLLGGIATSLLFSCFDSWLVAEHSKRDFDEASLSSTFSSAIFGNSCVAIASGIVAQYIASLLELQPLPAITGFHIGGFTAPFDLAIVILLVGAVVIQFTWSENYGERDPALLAAEKQQGQGGCVRAIVPTLRAALSTQGLAAAWRVLREDRSVMLIGLIQSSFEGAMYCFVFEWSPALMSFAADKEVLPFGRIFATFMLACMLGSQVFSLLVGTYGVSSSGILLLALGLGAVALAPAAMGMGQVASYSGFLLFELCVGLYFPSIGTLKSQIVPNAHRAGIYNLFRVPLNAVVLFVLLNDFSVPTTFMLCVSLLALGAALMWRLQTRTAASGTRGGQSCRQTCSRIIAGSIMRHISKDDPEEAAGLVPV